MHLLLTILLAFYPTIFIYTSIPSSWMSKVDALAPAGMGFFLAHLGLFVLVFFVVHMVFRKFISFSYGRGLRTGILGVALITAFTAALALIAFYNVLPGDIVYNSPSWVDAYLLKNPFTAIALAAPWVYLFFE